MIQNPKANARDFFECWPLDMITAIDSPHTWGVPTRFLQHMRGSREEWDKIYKPGYRAFMRAGVGSLLLVDCYPDPFNEAMKSVLDDLTQWGVLEDDCGFIGHWREVFKTGDANVVVSAYQRPESLLLIVQNRNRDAAAQARIEFDPQGLLPFRVTEAEAGDLEKPVPSAPALACSIRADGASWVLEAGPIAPRDFRLIRLARKENPGAKP
jgi:hypothetical protein